MNGTKLQVLICEGTMEMSWDGEMFYNGPVLTATDACYKIRAWSHLGFSETAEIWKFREEMVLA